MKKPPWLFKPQNSPPAVFDVDLCSVDDRNPWCSIAKWERLKPDDASLLKLMRHPPFARFVARPLRLSAVEHITYVSNEWDLPKWLRERLAVLRMAPDGAHVRGIGKRWDTRYYTIELNWERKDYGNAEG